MELRDVALTYYPGTNTTIQTAVTTSCFFMFFLMIYIGYILCNNDLDISEQCIYVRCHNKINYYLYKVICVLIFSIVFLVVKSELNVHNMTRTSAAGNVCTVGFIGVDMHCKGE